MDKVLCEIAGHLVQRKTDKDGHLRLKVNEFIMSALEEDQSWFGTCDRCGDAIWLDVDKIIKI